MTIHDQPLIKDLGPDMSGHPIYCPTCHQVTIHYQAHGSRVAVCVCGSAQHKCHGARCERYIPAEHVLCGPCEAIERR